MNNRYPGTRKETINSWHVCKLVAHLCLTLCDHMDWSPLGSFVYEIPQARILEWVAFPFSRGTS